MNKPYIMTHPLIKHKITMLRDANTTDKDFRLLIHEIALLMGYEATKDLPVADHKNPQTNRMKLTTRQIGFITATKTRKRKNLTIVSENAITNFPSVKIYNTNPATQGSRINALGIPLFCQ